MLRALLDRVSFTLYQLSILITKSRVPSTNNIFQIELIHKNPSPSQFGVIILVFWIEEVELKVKQNLVKIMALHTSEF